MLEKTGILCYNKHMNNQEKTTSQLHEIIEEKDNKIAQMDREINDLRNEIKRLGEQFKLMQARKFGRSSEKTNSNQLSFLDDTFNEAEHCSDPDEPEPELDDVVPKRRKQKGKREADFTNLPTEQVIHELPEEERVCPDCGGTMHECGHSVYRREVEFIPAQYKLLEHVQTTYGCRHCEKTSDHVPMKKSDIPKAVIAGSGIASPGLIAQIMHNKYTLALPLNRQEQELARHGIDLSRQTLCNWVLLSHEKWLSEIIKVLHAELIKQNILHADETTLKVLHENGEISEKKSYVWVYGTSKYADRQIVIYDYQPTRKGECAREFLEGFSGKLHTDGYDAYHRMLPKAITPVGCWAHMKRKFTDAIKSLPKKIQKQSPAQVGLRYCDQLFGIEGDCNKKELSPEERQRIREEKSRPIAEAFFAWAQREYNNHPTPRDLYGAALTYAKNQRVWLMNVFLDGRLELSNNRAERAVRPFAVGRKNWMFSNTPRGADASAAVYSIVETAKANGLNPFLYLKFLLERLPQGVPVEECLPWASTVQAICR